MNKSTKNHSLYSLISIAIDNDNTSENEKANQEICYMIKCSSDGPKVAAKILNKTIVKALTSRLHQTIWYTILLLDTAVKSTDSRFCEAILTKDFLTDLIKINDIKHGVPEFIREKFKYIMEDWVKTLTNVNGYDNLLKYNSIMIKTQDKRESMSSYPTSGTRGTVISQNALPIQPLQPQPQMNPQQIKLKFQKEIEIIDTNMVIFSDTLRQVNPDTVSNEEIQFLEELHEMSKKMQARINEALSYNSSLSEDLINELIQVNDKINATSERYKRLMAKKSQKLLMYPQLSKNSVDEENGYEYATVGQNNRNRSPLPEIYDMSGMAPPSYQANSKNKNPPVPDLINFDEESPTTSAAPAWETNLPTIPPRQYQSIDLLTNNPPVIPSTQPETNQSRMSEQEFDQFMNSITTSNQPSLSNNAGSLYPDSSELLDTYDYAPPLYDEAKKSSAKPTRMSEPSN